MASLISFDTQQNTNNLCQIAMVLSNNVKASMKVEVYNVTLIITNEDLLACSCTCKVGSSGLDRFMCVHILLVLFSLLQLLLDGLAGHLLGEFASVYTNKDNEKLSQLLSFVN
jgi:hypothetical protein